MADYYVDLGGAGGGDGSEGNPFNFDELLANSVSGGLNGAYHIKGSISTDQQIFIQPDSGESFSWVEWISATYNPNKEPWRINSTFESATFDGTNQSVLIRGGIISLPNTLDFIVTNTTFINDFMIIGTGASWSVDTITFLGCTLKVGNPYGIHNFTDSIVIASVTASLSSSSVFK